jgi:hypothetical protein
MNQGNRAYALLDYDVKGLPPEVVTRLGGSFWSAIVKVVPELTDAARLQRASTSAGLYRSDTGFEFADSSGLHVYILVKDGSDIERFLTDLHRRCWLAGFGWLMVGAGGQLLERSIVDRMVGAPERLVFEGPPVLDPPLAQDLDKRRPEICDGKTLHTLVSCPPLTIVEINRFQELKAKETQRLKPEAQKARKAFIAKQTQRLTGRTGLSNDAAARIIEQQCRGILLPHVELPFDDADLAGCTVGDVLADPGRFDYATLADPLEGIAYGCSKAKIMLRTDGTPLDQLIRPRSHDLSIASRAIAGGSTADVIQVFVKKMLNAEVDAAERQELIDLAAGSKARPLLSKSVCCRLRAHSLANSCCQPARPCWNGSRKTF